MIHKLIVTITTDSRDEANGIATEVEQILSAKHADKINVRPLPTASVEGEEKLVTKARDEWEREGEVEFDDDPVVSRGADRGAYVQAWVWVYDPDDEVITTGNFTFRASQENGDHVDCKSCGKRINDDTDEGICTNQDGFAFCSPKCLLDDHDEGETLHAFYKDVPDEDTALCGECGDTAEGLMHNNTERNIEPLLWEGE